jgi:hypothetical protein
MSVNVPPMSTPTRKPAIWELSILCDPSTAGSHQ